MNDLFTIDPNPTFTLPVPLPVPGRSPVAVTFRFRHMDREAFFAMLEESREKKESTADFLARFVDGWEGENINAAFSKESLDKLTRNYPKAGQAIFAAYEGELIGVLAKN